MAQKGLNVLVTGGASGLGEGIVICCAQAGARVIIADQNEQLGRAIEQRLAADGHNVKFVVVDVTSVASQIMMLREALAWLPKHEAFDSVVLCAGINGNPLDLTPEDPAALEKLDTLNLLDRNAATLQVNLVSVLQVVQLLVKYGMGLGDDNGSAVSGRKSITLIGSLASYRALPRAVDYSAAKWGIRGAFRSLRQQLPKAGIRVNMVAPGFVKTPLLTQMLPVYESMGVKFVAKEHVVEAVIKVMNDYKINGQSFGVSSEGIVDMRDDTSGMDAYETMTAMVSRGALGSSGCPMGNDELRS